MEAFILFVHKVRTRYSYQERISIFLVFRLRLRSLQHFVNWWNAIGHVSNQARRCWRHIQVGYKIFYSHHNGPPSLGFIVNVYTVVEKWMRTSQYLKYDMVHQTNRCWSTMTFGPLRAKKKFVNLMEIAIRWWQIENETPLHDPTHNA